jgi:hypothetical protein
MATKEKRLHQFAVKAFHGVAVPLPCKKMGVSSLHSSFDEGGKSHSLVPTP